MPPEDESDNNPRFIPWEDWSVTHPVDAFRDMVTRTLPGQELDETSLAEYRRYLDAPCEIVPVTMSVRRIDHETRTIEEIAEIHSPGLDSAMREAADRLSAALLGGLIPEPQYTYSSFTVPITERLDFHATQSMRIGDAVTIERDGVGEQWFVSACVQQATGVFNIVCVREQPPPPYPEGATFLHLAQEFELVSYQIGATIVYNGLPVLVQSIQEMPSGSFEVTLVVRPLQEPANELWTGGTHWDGPKQDKQAKPEQASYRPRRKITIPR
jgi:hypothetical protein